MKEYLNNAKEELKRVEHQIYVSLKYTRTIDVLINIMNRMIDAYEDIIEALLIYLKDKKKIESIPQTPKEKGELLKLVFNDVTVQENLELYFLLRKIVRASFEKQNEYRRHVALITYINSKQEIINIDIITQYYHFQTSFLNYVENLTKE